MVEARAAFFCSAAEFTPLLSVDSGRARYLVSTADHGVSKSLFARRARGEMRLLARGIQILEVLGLGDRVRAGTFVDIGGNIGTTTITAMCVEGFARAVACEPEPTNQQLLELNLVANDLERDVVICPAAIGDRDGKVELLVNKRQSGGHEVHISGRAVPEDSTAYAVLTVRQVTLNTLASNGTLDPEDVTVLWMDAQGHEGHVLRGASSLTERGVPIMMEFFPGMMDRHGGLDYFREVAAKHYTHFVSLHRVRGKAAGRFDLNPIGELAAETERLLAGARVTDILLVRDPRSAPAAPGGAGRPIESRDKERAADRPLRDQTLVSPEERERFLAKAAPVTQVVAAEIDGATFLVRTSADTSERVLFTHRSHPRLRLLETVLAALDDLGLGDLRQRTLVETSAGTGISTVAAIRWHGFDRALACEAEPSDYRILKLNVATNGLRDRVRSVPVALGSETDGREELPLDHLQHRGLIERGDTGLVWIEHADPARILRGAPDLLESRPPLLMRVDANSSGDPLLDTDGAAGAYTRLLRVDDAHVLALSL